MDLGQSKKRTFAEITGIANSSQNFTDLPAQKLLRNGKNTALDKGSKCLDESYNLRTSTPRRY
jgi:hypothetical protein